MDCILYENFECMKDIQRNWLGARNLFLIWILEDKRQNSLEQVIAKGLYDATKYIKEVIKDYSVWVVFNIVSSSMKFYKKQKNKNKQKKHI